MSSLTLTMPSPLGSQAGQADAGCAPSATLTQVMRSATDTIASPAQSPTHGTGVAVGVGVGLAVAVSMAVAVTVAVA
jgi:hypothetical protein